MAARRLFEANSAYQQMHSQPIRPPELINEERVLQLFTLHLRGMHMYRDQVALLVNIRPDLWDDAAETIKVLLEAGDNIRKVDEQMAIQFMRNVEVTLPEG